MASVLLLEPAAQLYPGEHMPPHLPLDGRPVEENAPPGQSASTTAEKPGRGEMDVAEDSNLIVKLPARGHSASYVQ
jgi:hypothetical protein